MIVDLPISEKKVKFLNKMLKEIEYSYHNQYDNKTFYKDRAFEIMSYDKYLQLIYLCIPYYEPNKIINNTTSWTTWTINTTIFSKNAI